MKENHLNLVKSHELICHFIILYLVPLPPQQTPPLLRPSQVSCLEKLVVLLGVIDPPIYVTYLSFLLAVLSTTDTPLSTWFKKSLLPGYIA